MFSHRYTKVNTHSSLPLKKMYSTYYEKKSAPYDKNDRKASVKQYCAANSNTGIVSLVISIMVTVNAFGGKYFTMIVPNNIL